MNVRTLLVGTSAALVFASVAEAQSRQFISVQASGLLTSLHGDAFDALRIGTGFGGEFQLRLNPGRLSIGVGFQYTDHSSTSQGLSNEMTLTGFFLEPRYVLPVDSRRVRPYLAGRLALLRQKTDLEDLAITYEVKANAIAIGAGGGLVARINDLLGFDLGIALTSADFGEYEYRNDGGPSGIDAGSGMSFVVKAGLNIGLGAR